MKAFALAWPVNCRDFSDDELLRRFDDKEFPYNGEVGVEEDLSTSEVSDKLKPKFTTKMSHDSIFDYLCYIKKGCELAMFDDIKLRVMNVGYFDNESEIDSILLDLDKRLDELSDKEFLSNFKKELDIFLLSKFGRNFSAH